MPNEETMDERLRKLCSELRSMDSESAITWIMEKYPITEDSWGEAVLLLPHRSWEKKDQLKLANYYLSRVPFASARGYEAFASFMSVSALVGVLRKYIPSEPSDRDLFRYYVIRVLENAAKHEKDKKLVKDFSKLI